MDTNNKLIENSENENMNKENNFSSVYEKIILEKINKQFKVLTETTPCNNYIVDDELGESISLLEIESRGLYGKHFSVVPENINEEFNIGDEVVYSYEDCEDIAIVKEVGTLSRIKRKCQSIPVEEFSKIVRKTNQDDLAKKTINTEDVNKARPIFLELNTKYELNMKLVDIHYQFDRKKLFFFYTADGRVDFRELAKSLAAKFKTRIELRQIGVRDETKKMGGIGTCGREFCCSTFLTNFKRITTQLANEQNLTTNLSKLSGPCGKLKCCLSYEVDKVDLEKIAETRLDAIVDTEQ